MAIWNLGSINIDHVYRLDHLPRPGETLAARSYVQGLGGKGANQSIAAAQAGAITHHIGAMGATDDWVVERLKNAGVCTADILRLPGQATGHAIILLDGKAENAIVIHPGANRAIAPSMLAKLLSAIKAQDTLLLQNETGCQVEAAKAARQVGARVIYSAAPFDIEDVFFSHRGDLCSFDVMLAELGLSVPALDRLAVIVRAADTARLDLAPEAAGLLAVSLGLSRMYADDLEQLEAGMLVYDALYRWVRDATGETHNWPTNKPRAE